MDHREATGNKLLPFIVQSRVDGWHGFGGLSGVDWITGLRCDSELPQ